MSYYKQGMVMSLKSLSNKEEIMLSNKENVSQNVVLFLMSANVGFTQGILTQLVYSK